MRLGLRAGLTLVVLTLSGLSGPRIAEAAELPRVRLIATGGTISNLIPGRLTATQLVRLVPHSTATLRPRRRTLPTCRAAR